MIIAFFLAYVLMALEHSIKINKAAFAMMLGMSFWIYLVLSGQATDHNALHYFTEHGKLLFFLLGVMTLIEVMDSHGVFSVFADIIRKKNQIIFVTLVSIVTFFMSSILDNMTTTIVMISILRKMIEKKENLLLFSSLVVIVSNAGGAWSPIGDVTTTMLWVGGQISTWGIIKSVFIPSIVCTMVATWMMNRKITDFELMSKLESDSLTLEKTIVLVLGILSLIMVPVMKFWHIEPYMTILLCLSVVWVAVEIIHLPKPHEEKKEFTPHGALEKIDTPSILFLLGILMAVSALDHQKILVNFASEIDRLIPSRDIVAIVIGMLSAVIDNVPQVSAAMSMYPLATPDIIANGVMAGDSVIYNNITYLLPDARFYKFLAYTAGTGGSILIIGSVAGIAAMSSDSDLTFSWYLKKVSWIALVSFLAGAIIFIIQ